MIFLQNIFIAEFELYGATSILLMVVAIILIIIVITAVIYFRSEFSNKKKFKYDSDYQDDNYLNERILLEKKNDNKDHSLLTRYRQFEERNKDLVNENGELRDEIHSLKRILDGYYERYGALSNSTSSNVISQSLENANNVISQNAVDTNSQGYNKTSKINVAFSFEEKNGTVKKDESGDMYLEKSGDYYELLFGKEIYGTAIHLEQLQYCYKILNPKEANNKPMLVIKKHQYLFDQSDEKGILHQKGEVKYQ